MPATGCRPRRGRRSPGWSELGLPLAHGIERLAAALKRLAALLRRRLEDPDDPPEPGLRQRLDATVRGLDRRADQQLAAWARLLRDLAEPARPETVEWLVARPHRRARNRCRGDPQLGRPGHPVRRIGGAPGAWPGGDLGDPDRRRPRPRPRLARRRSRDRPAPSAGQPWPRRASPRRSTIGRRPASLS